MKVVGVRALKQNASAVVADAAAGEVTTITDRGRAVAQLVPLSMDRLTALTTSGRARPARAAIGDLPPALKRKPGQRPLTEVLAEARAAERY